MRFVKSAAVFVLAVLLAGCGFQLRGTANLPFASVYLPPGSGGVALDLKRNIQSGTNTKVVCVPDWILRLRSKAMPPFALLGM